MSKMIEVCKYGIGLKKIRLINPIISRLLLFQHLWKFIHYEAQKIILNSTLPVSVIYHPPKTP